MPSGPAAFTLTAAPVTAAPLIPATNVLVCVPVVPIRILLDSPATPALPILILLLPVVSLTPAAIEAMVVATARLVKEGVNSVRDVVVAGCVVAECTVADPCVVVAIAASERESSDCRVAAAS